MMPLGTSLEGLTPSDRTGAIICRTIRTKYPQLPLICISVIINRDTIHEIKKTNVHFLRYYLYIQLLKCCLIQE